jgi:hypothetical protein
MQVLEEKKWREAARRHRERLNGFVEAHRSRRSRGEKHPVWDFLFDYYSFRPALLLKWSPGLGVELRGDVSGFSVWKEFAVDEAGAREAGARLDLKHFPAQRAEPLRQIRAMLERTAASPAFHGCFGLHEWAMVYRCEQVRHGQVALRLSNDEISEFVDSQSIRCSHYDAFRFFTPRAAPLNTLQPDSASRWGLEQRGCIHANMDLYKWAYKYFPWIGSGVVADAFEVLVFAREVDMRASPYDLRAWGFEPIRIETPEGRREYQEWQREIADRALPVRLELLARLRDLEEALAPVQVRPQVLAPTPKDAALVG